MWVCVFVFTHTLSLLFFFSLPQELLQKIVANDPIEYKSIPTVVVVDEILPHTALVIAETNDNSLPIVIDYYKQVFQSCGIGIAIAKMDGTVLDCNEAFSLWSGFSTDSIKSKTIFDFFDTNDLQHAFDVISQLLISSMSPLQLSQQVHEPTSVVVRRLQRRSSSNNNTQDQNIRITLIRSKTNHIN
jgi:PAS domain-containing protein